MLIQLKYQHIEKQTKSMNLLIYGSGATGREVLDLVDNLSIKRWKDIAFVVDENMSQKNYLEGKNIFCFNDLPSAFFDSEILIAVGEPDVRRKMYKKASSFGLQVTQLIDNSVYMSKSSIIESGCILYPGVKVSSNTKLKKNVLIAFNTVVGHDIEVGENTFLSSGINIGGGVKIGSNTFVGLGSVIKEGVSIGNESIIGMGSIVYKDIPDNVIALGNPARVMRRNDGKKVFTQNN